MGRKRRSSREEQSSFVEDAAELIIVTSRRWPIVGLVFCIGFITFGGYLQTQPKAMVGLARLIGLVMIFAGLCCGGLAVMGMLRNLRETGASILRAVDSRRTSSGPSPSSSPAPMATRPASINRVWTTEKVAALSWQQFERLIADLFRRQGYAVRETGRDAQRTGVGDGGVDLILTTPESPGAEFLVQCKQYKVWSVGEPKVREFYGAMAAWKTRCEGILITCGRFTQAAEAFAAGKPLRLIDGDGLLRLLNQHNALAPSVTTAAPAAVIAASRPNPPTVAPTAQPSARLASPPSPAQSPPGVPACPNCKVAMVRRVAGKGQRKGHAFWGA